MHEHIIGQGLIDELSAVGRADFIPSSVGPTAPVNLHYFVHNIAESIEKPISTDPKDVQRGSHRFPFLIPVIGFPTSGKTHLAELIADYLGLFGSIHRLSWEQAEDEARSAELIFTPIDKPYTRAELITVESRLKRSLKEAMMAARDIVLEVPGVPEVRFKVPYENKVVTRGRKLGGILAIQALNQTGIFRATPHYEHRVVGAIGGQILRQYSELWRDGIKKVEVNAKNPDDPINLDALDQISYLCQLFGKIPPISIPEMVHKQRQGASLEQIATIKDSYHRVIDWMRVYRVMDQVTYAQRFDYPRTVEQTLLEYFITNKYNLNIKNRDEHAFIAYNDPDFEKLSPHWPSWKAALDKYVYQHGFPEDIYAFAPIP